MKKQINPTIKAHLIRGAFYLLLLTAVCAIPFALAQRNAPKRAMSNSAKIAPSRPNAASQLRPNDVRVVPASRSSNKAASGPTGGVAVKNLRMPVYPQAVLYDQYDNDLLNGIVSADRTDDPSLSAETADNFVVPNGQT